MKNKKVYIRLIVSYLAAFMIPLLVNLFALEEIGEYMEESIGESILSNLSHARESIEDKFEELDTIVENLTNNNTIRYIAVQMDEEDKKIEISKLQSARDTMSLMQVQTFVEEYYLYFDKSDMVITPTTIYLEQESLENFFHMTVWAGRNGRSFFPTILSAFSCRRRIRRRTV